jgi:hypothetical protein
MKKIVILLVTLLGICKGFAQNPSDSIAAAGKKAGLDSLVKKNIASVKLYPNPTKNKVELECTGFQTGPVQLQIISTGGKIVRNDSRQFFSGNENMVVMFSLTPGIYFVLLKQKDTLVKKKMVVE